MKKLIAIAISAVIVVFMLFNSLAAEEKQSDYEKVNEEIVIMTTDEYSKQLIKAITGDKNVVECMFNEPIPYRPIVNLDLDVRYNIEKSDLFIYYGDDYDKAVKTLLKDASRNNLTVTYMNRGIDKIPLNNPITINGNKYTTNPYYYGNINNLLTIFFNIKTSLQEVDPKNNRYYEDNFAKIEEKILEKEKTLRDVLEIKKELKIVTADEKVIPFLVGLNVDYKYIKDIKDEAELKSLDEFINDKTVQVYLDKKIPGKDNLKSHSLNIYENYSVKVIDDFTNFIINN